MPAAILSGNQAPLYWLHILHSPSALPPRHASPCPAPPSRHSGIIPLLLWTLLGAVWLLSGATRLGRRRAGQSGA